MNSPEFYMIYINRMASVSYDEVEARMNKALDWYRITESLWIVYSNSTPERLYERLSPLVKDSGNVFICELNVHNRQGWMKKGFWKWLKEER